MSRPLPREITVQASPMADLVTLGAVLAIAALVPVLGITIQLLAM